MSLHPNVRRCTHIQITGHRCGSPALKQEYFCYFHTRMIKGVQTRVDSQIHPIALIENAEAIQAAIMHMIDAVLKGTIDNKRANIVLKALHIAVRNSRNVYFDLREDDMVREVPNYAQQYLTEHPELNPPEPHAANAPEPQAESKKRAQRNQTTAQIVPLPPPPRQPRSGARMQPTAQAVGTKRKIMKLRRSEREVAIPSPSTPLPHSPLASRNVAQKSKSWKPQSKAPCAATGVTFAPYSTPSA